MSDPNETPTTMIGPLQKSAGMPDDGERMPDSKPKAKNQDASQAVEKAFSPNNDSNNSNNNKEEEQVVEAPQQGRLKSQLKMPLNLDHSFLEKKGDLMRSMKDTTTTRWTRNLWRLRKTLLRLPT
jgi:hypothetical protein